VILLDDTLWLKETVDWCVCVSREDSCHDALYLLRSLGYKLFLFTKLTFACKILSLHAAAARGFVEWRCDARNVSSTSTPTPHPPTPQTLSLPLERYLCAELYHILQSSLATVENGVKSKPRGRNVTF
jgi:hypothetical protein